MSYTGKKLIEVNVRRTFRKIRWLGFLLLLASAQGAGQQGQIQKSNGWEKLPEVLAAINAPTFFDNEYDISDFGAVGDGETDARPAILAAIDRANAEGGGKVLIPAGEWFSDGPIHLKSNVNLHLAEGARLIFTEDPSRYLPQVLTRWEGTEVYNYSPLIYAYQAVNVGITGKGIIDGNAEQGFATWRSNQQEAQNRLRQMGRGDVPVHERVFGEGDWLRPSMIQFYSCDNVLVEDITVYDSPMWVVHFVYSQNVTVRGITVESFRLNNDGISVDSSVNVLAENNRLITGDDSIVVKSGRDQDAWRVGRPSKNIVIRNNWIEGHNALAVGSEMSGGVWNIFMMNNRLGKTRSALYFKSNLDRGGVIEHVRIRNIQADTADRLIRFNTNYHSHRGGHYPSLYRDFLIENVTADNVEIAIEARGIEELPIQDVLIRDLRVDRAEQPVIIQHVENFVLENAYINGEVIEIGDPRVSKQARPQTGNNF
jgi:polygalacturonase